MVKKFNKCEVACVVDDTWFLPFLSVLEYENPAFNGESINNKCPSRPHVLWNNFGTPFSILAGPI